MTICEHIKDNGDTCGSPALTGYDYCYFHQRLRQPRHRPSDFEYKLPILDTPESILMATQHITQAALDGVLEDRRARLVLSALRLAMTTLKAIKKEENAGKEKHVGTDLPVRPTRAQLADSPAADKAPSAATAAPEGSPWREPWVSVTSTPKAPAGATDTPASPKKPPQPAPLSATQTKLLKKIIRRGPKHPQFKLAARLLDRHISTT
jgi:hypothetical protein